MAWFEISYTSPTGDVEEWGRINFILYDNVVPMTAENFRTLCTYDEGSGYKGSKFRYVIKGSMAGGGDIIAPDGSFAKSIWGERFRDENFKKKHDKPYLLSMANSGPNTNGTRFFITFANSPRCNNHHVVFGEVADESSKEIVRKMDTKSHEMWGRTFGTITITDCGAY